MACSRIFPMNDLDLQALNDAVERHRQHERSGDGKAENRRKDRRRGRRGGRLFALGGFLLLAGGLALGGWGDYSLKQEVMATAKQQHDFVPSLHVAAVEANPAIVSVALP